MQKVEYALISIPPGQILEEEFLKPLGITKYRLAKEIGVPAGRIGQIVAGKRAVSADTDLRLCKFFDKPNGYFINAQTAYDTEIAEHELADELSRIKPWGSAA